MFSLVRDFFSFLSIMVNIESQLFKRLREKSNYKYSAKTDTHIPGLIEHQEEKDRRPERRTGL